MSTTITEMVKTTPAAKAVASIRSMLRGLPVGDYVVTDQRGPSVPRAQPGRYALVRRKHGWDICGWNAGGGNWVCRGWHSVDAYAAANNGTPEYRTAIDVAEALVAMVDADALLSA